MKNIILAICALSIFSCGKVDDLHDAATKVIPQKMENLAQSTAELKRIETVKTAVQELNDPKTYKKLSPVPVDLLAWNKVWVDDNGRPKISDKLEMIVLPPLPIASASAAKKILF